MASTYIALLNSIAVTLRTVSGIEVVEVLDTLTEGVNTMPSMKIYADNGMVSQNSQTDRTTFGAGIRETAFDVIINVFGKNRANISQDMVLQMTLLDNITTVLETQNRKNYFGNSAIKAFRWTWERMTFQTEGTMQVVGLQVTLSIVVF